MIKTTQYIQPTGETTDAPVLYSGVSTYASGEVWTPDDTLAPVTSETDSIVLVDSYDSGTGRVTIKGSEVHMNSSGYVVDPVIFNNAIEQSISTDTMELTPTEAAYVVDLTQGTSIKVNMAQDLTLSFANAPVDKLMFLNFIILNVGTGSSFKLNFSGVTLKIEGGQTLPLFKKDLIYSFSAILFARNSIIHLMIKTPSQALIPIAGAISYAVENTATVNTVQPLETPVLTAPSENTVVTFTGSGLFRSSSVTLVDNTFTGSTYMSGCRIKMLYFNLVYIKASELVGGALVLNYSLGVNFILEHDADITSVTLLNKPPRASVLTIYREKDATEEVRSIDWLGSGISYDVEPQLTQTSGGSDILKIECPDGVNTFLSGNVGFA